MSTDDQFEVFHPRLDDNFVFSCSEELDTIGHTVRAQGLTAYEAPLTDLVIEIVKSDPRTVLDVGANTGLYALTVAATSRSVQVIAFEPLESVRKLLKANIDANTDLVSRIAIEPLGLSNQSGTYKFYETINRVGLVSTSSSFEHGHVQQVGDDYAEHVIRTMTLDEFGETLGRRGVSFMKIDVEGHEHAVISGGRHFINRHRPIITVEILGLAEVEPINRLLLEGDYMSFAVAPDALRQCDRAMFFSDAWNHLLVPVEKVTGIFAICRRLGLRIDLH